MTITQEQLEKIKQDHVMCSEWQAVPRLVAEVERLVSEVERLREALGDIARQKTRAEIERELAPDQFDDPDFEGAYDMMIEVARAALTQEQ